MMLCCYSAWWWIRCIFIASFNIVWHATREADILLQFENDAEPILIGFNTDNTEWKIKALKLDTVAPVYARYIWMIWYF